MKIKIKNSKKKKKYNFETESSLDYWLDQAVLEMKRNLSSYNWYYKNECKNSKLWTKFK